MLCPSGIKSNVCLSNPALTNLGSNHGSTTATPDLNIISENHRTNTIPTSTRTKYKHSGRFNTKLDKAVGGAIARLVAPSASSSRALGVESPRHELILLPSVSSIIHSDRSATSTLATLLVFNTKLDKAVGGAAVGSMLNVCLFYNPALSDRSSTDGSNSNSGNNSVSRNDGTYDRT